MAAQLDALNGKRSRAQQGVARAIAEATTQGMKPELARAHAAVAQLLGGGGEIAGKSAAQHRETARALFTELGLSRDADALGAGDAA